MTFTQSPTKDKFEVLMENVTVAQAIAFSKVKTRKKGNCWPQNEKNKSFELIFQKLGNTSIHGSKLELVPIFLEKFPRNAVNAVCEKMGVSFDEGKNKNLSGTSSLLYVLFSFSRVFSSSNSFCFPIRSLRTPQ